jgi:glycosyltransferase involved in cell wall biosynthesis
MKISVIIPTFNRAEFLDRTILSVLNQSYSAGEIILVDDGSEDNTEDVVKKHGIKYIYKQNAGVSSARNMGIKESKNEWVAFLDSDDQWHIDKLKLQVDFHKQNSDIVFSHTDESWLYNGKIKNKKKIHKKPFGECFLQNIDFCKIGASTAIMHKTIFDDVGLFDESLPVCEDYDMWLRISKKYSIGYIDKELIIKHAGHENQLSFSGFGFDRFRVSALLKHIDGLYADDVKKEIIKKCDILIQGAKKHNNEEIIKTYQCIKKSLL